MSLANATVTLPVRLAAGPPRSELVNRLIDQALEGNPFAAELAARMVPRPVPGLPTGLTISFLKVGRCPGRWSPWAMRHPIAYEVGVPVYAHAGGIFPGSPLKSRAGKRTSRGLARSSRSRSRSSRSPRSPGSRPGTGDPGLSAGSVPGRPDRRSGDEPGGRRAAGLPRVRAVPRRPAARGADEAARGARRPGRARPLAGPAPAVRRRRGGVRRDRGDPRPRDRAGRLARPGLPPGLRGRARLLAVAEPRRAGPEGPAGPARAWAGRTTTTTPSAARGGSSRGSSGCSRRSASSSASGSTPASTPAGAPRSSSTRRPGS